MTDSRILDQMHNQTKALVELRKSMDANGKTITASLERIAAAYEMMFGLTAVQAGGLDVLAAQVAETVAEMGMAGPKAETTGA